MRPQVIRPRDGALRSIKDVGNALGQSVSESETLLDLTQTLLQRGELSRADFVRRYAPEAQPVAGAGMLCATSSGSATEGVRCSARCALSAERETPAVSFVVGRIFNELLMAAFREYDSDADGFLTPPEVLTFLQGHGLHYVADRAFVPVDDNVQFGDFKSLLLDTCILSLYAPDGKIQLSKEVADNRMIYCGSTGTDPISLHRRCPSWTRCAKNSSGAPTSTAISSYHPRIG